MLGVFSPNFDELLLLTDSITHADVICITESWLCPDILDPEILISGYQTMRQDRNRHGGVVLMYVLDISTLFNGFLPMYLLSCLL